MTDTRDLGQVRNIGPSLNSLGFMHDKIRISSNVLYLNLKLKQTKKKKKEKKSESRVCTWICPR